MGCVFENRVGNNQFLGMRKAVVKKVDGDKNDCNGITVQLCGSDLTLENVPVTVDMASKEFGRVVIPKEGDYVALGFFEADVEQPVVLGSFYDPARKPPIQVDDKNNINYFQTATGMKMTINDSKDDGGIYIETKDGHTVTLKDASDQFVELKDKNGKVSLKIDLKSGEIDIKCKKMSVDAQNEILMKSGGTEVSIKGSSGVNMKSSSGSINMDAININEKAKANVSINANAKLDAKANAMANFSSNAMTSIGGSLVKIG